jgi:hypothetical protein
MHTDLWLLDKNGSLKACWAFKECNEKTKVLMTESWHQWHFGISGHRMQHEKVEKWFGKGSRHSKTIWCFINSLSLYYLLYTRHYSFFLICTLQGTVTLFFKNYSFIHMCICCLGHFSPLPAPLPSLPLPPQSQAGPVLPLSLILLKKRHSIIRKIEHYS